MIITPITAACFIISKGYPIKVFGLQLIAGGQVMSESMANCVATLGSLHSPFALLMILMVLGHITMAIKHRVQKDPKLLKMI